MSGQTAGDEGPFGPYVPSLRAQVTRVARGLRREADGIEADPYLNKFAREADAGARRTAAARIETAVTEDRSRPAPTVRDGIEQALRTLRRLSDGTVPPRRARVKAAIAESERLIREAYDGTDEATAAREPQPAPELAAAADVRPRDGEPGWHDVTCGSCSAQFGTNFRIEEIECAECEARRCPNCATWFGGEL